MFSAGQTLRVLAIATRAAMSRSEWIPGHQYRSDVDVLLEEIQRLRQEVRTGPRVRRTGSSIIGRNGEKNDS